MATAYKVRLLDGIDAMATALGENSGQQSGSVTYPENALQMGKLSAGLLTGCNTSKDI